MDKVVELLKNRSPKLCVLSTVNDQKKPESAIVGFAVKDDCTLLFSTQKSTRKYVNIKQNTYVSFVTGFSFTEANIQIDGTAQIIEDTSSAEYQSTEAFFFTQNPDAAKFKTNETIFIILTPNWVRLMDHTSTPSTVAEFHL